MISVNNAPVNMINSMDMAFVKVMGINDLTVLSFRPTTELVVLMTLSQKIIYDDVSVEDLVCVKTVKLAEDLLYPIHTFL